MCNETEIFKNYEKLINKKSFDIANQFNRDLNEAKSMVMDVFRKVVAEYNPDLGAFSTYFFAACKSIHTLSIKEVIREREEVSIDEVDVNGNSVCDSIPSEDPTLHSFEIEESANGILSEDAQRVLHGLYDGLFEAGRSSNKLPGARYISEYAQEHWGWNCVRGLHAFEEIEKWYKLEIAC